MRHNDWYFYKFVFSLGYSSLWGKTVRLLCTPSQYWKQLSKIAGKDRVVRKKNTWKIFLFLGNHFTYWYVKEILWQSLWTWSALKQLKSRYFLWSSLGPRLSPRTPSCLALWRCTMIWRWRGPCSLSPPPRTRSWSPTPPPTARLVLKCCHLFFHVLF